MSKASNAWADLVRSLPDAVVLGIFERYARPLAEPAPPMTTGDVQVALGDRGASVRSTRFLGFGDVIANDYLVLEQPDHEPVALPAKLGVAALRALLEASHQ